MKQVIRATLKALVRRGSLHNTTLGRWKIDYNPDTTGRKVDLSNEDHCGTCGEYVSSFRKDVEIPRKKGK